MPCVVTGRPAETVGFEGGADGLVGLVVKNDLQAVLFGVADDLEAVVLLGSGGDGLLCLEPVKLCHAGLYPFDLAAQAGKLEVGHGALCKGRGAGDGCVVAGGEVVAHARKTAKGLAFVKLVLQAAELGAQHFACVGVGQIDGTRANALDFVQDGFDILVLGPQAVLAGILPGLFAYWEITGTAHQHAGAAGPVAVVVVRPLGQAAGVAVEKRVQLVVVVGAGGRLVALHQGSGLVHGGTDAGAHERRHNPNISTARSDPATRRRCGHDSKAVPRAIATRGADKVNQPSKAHGFGCGSFFMQRR